MLESERDADQKTLIELQENLSTLKMEEEKSLNSSEKQGYVLYVDNMSVDKCAQPSKELWYDKIRVQYHFKNLILHSPELHNMADHRTIDRRKIGRKK